MQANETNEEKKYKSNDENGIKRQEETAAIEKSTISYIHYYCNMRENIRKWQITI